MSNPHSVFQLVPRTLLKMGGPDRLRYLNGQVTQDLRRLKPDQALPACVLSAKGKLQAEVWIRATEDALWIDAPHSQQEELLQRLERYIVADDVCITDCSGDFDLWHCVSPELPNAEIFLNTMAFHAQRLGPGGRDFWSMRADRERWSSALSPSLGTPAEWEHLRIQRGIPAWGAELDEHTLPPEAGLDKSHIDFHKGCYIGQEVISRLKSVGRVNRSLLRFTGAGAPSPGAELLCAHSGAPAGVLTSVTQTQTSAETPLFLALGYVKRGLEASSYVLPGGALVTVCG